MRSLKEIRTAADRRGTIKEAKSVLVPETPKTKHTVLKKIAAKSREKVLSEKQKKIDDINNEIETKKKELLQTGETILSDAKAKAERIIKQANQDAYKAITLKNRLEIEREILNQAIQKANESAERNEKEIAVLTVKSETLKKIGDGLELKRSDTERANRQSKALLGEIAAILTVVFKRLDIMETFSETGRDYITELVHILEAANETFNERQIKLDAKDERLGNRDKELDMKQAAIKEQRLQLDNASHAIRYTK